MLKMIKLLKKYSKKYSSWGWKDPRTCLTIFKWYEVMKFLSLEDQLKIVYVSRNASSVARSLNKRNNLDIEKGLAIWEVYSTQLRFSHLKGNLSQNLIQFSTL